MNEVRYKKNMNWSDEKKRRKEGREEGINEEGKAR